MEEMKKLNETELEAVTGGAAGSDYDAFYAAYEQFDEMKSDPSYRMYLDVIEEIANLCFEVGSGTGSSPSIPSALFTISAKIESMSGEARDRARSIYDANLRPLTSG